MRWEGCFQLKGVDQSLMYSKGIDRCHICDRRDRIRQVRRRRWLRFPKSSLQCWEGTCFKGEWGGVVPQGERWRRESDCFNTLYSKDTRGNRKRTKWCGVPMRSREP